MLCATTLCLASARRSVREYRGTFSPLCTIVQHTFRTRLCLAMDLLMYGGAKNRNMPIDETLPDVLHDLE